MKYSAKEIVKLLLGIVEHAHKSIHFVGMEFDGIYCSKLHRKWNGNEEILRRRMKKNELDKSAEKF